MRLLRIRLAIVVLFGCAVLVALAGEIHAQRQRNSRTGPRTAQNPNQRAATTPSGRTSPAQANAAPSSQRLAQPVLEKADPETKAAFLKLIGANWIWSPAYEKDNAPVGDCYFRKAFPMAAQAELAQVHIACDNQYELYVNGQLAGRGADWRKMDVHDVTKLLTTGNNVIAVKATNADAGAAGLVVRVVIKQKGGTFESFSSDGTWRTSVKLFANWTRPNVRDAEWLPAKVYGPLGGVLPWGDEIVIADEGSRFLIDPEFAVERLIADEQAGSLIAMKFNADGNILASQEGGPLLLIRDTDRDGKFETVAPFCSELKNVQGMLPLGNRVYAVGDGPDGGALYQIVDQDGDGRSDQLTTVVKFRGNIGEHGPHTVHLGPDGLLYLLVGNFAQVEAQADPRSPYANAYEGDLVQPRNEDPNGHAAGLTAPGGTITRTDMTGSFVETVAGGFRNPYDFAFNNDGELFTYDADMEWDIGAPWYRPTRVNHVSAGAEFGWRSGWAKWPEYYLDNLPAALDVGPGSPTGVAFYDHVMFPVRLQKSLFVGDWATGQIHAVKFERNGGTYKAKVSTILKGRPLNVTGLDVGPDGALYFCTGGRGTDGGVYRIRWTGNVPPQAIQFGQGIEQALHQPQFQSDWARMRIAAVKRSLGDQWQSELERVIANPQAPPTDRARAVDLLSIFGPAPTPEMLAKLSDDSAVEVRVRAVRLMGMRNDPSLAEPLAEKLGDFDPWVRRVACESVAHRGDQVPIATLIGLLSDKDRFVAFAARRALERRPAQEWQEQVLTAQIPRTFFYGATGLLAAYPSPQLAQQILNRCEAMLRGEVSEPGQEQGQLTNANYLDMLRVTQLALLRGQVAPQTVPTLAQELLKAYPTRDAMKNRELVRLLTYLQPPQAAHALATQLTTNVPEVEKFQIAAYAPRITSGWDTPDKLIMLRYYEQLRDIEGGHSMGGYVENFARDFFATFTLAERRQVIAVGESFPTSTLSILAKLPEDVGPDVLTEIRNLDTRLEGKPGEQFARLRVGIVAVLGRSGDAESFAYLRKVYLADPQRRASVAMSLTQHPDGDNWEILVDSLRTLEGAPAQEVLNTLASIKRRPETSEPYRNAILLGLRLQSGGEPAVKLVEHWTGQPMGQPGTPLDQRFAACQAWYAGVFPNELPAELPKESQPNKWSFDELVSFLDSPAGQTGSPSRGAEVFRTAQCVSCHRFNGQGEGIGPDLTAVSQRFQRKEILESIVYPAQVVSDQYASQIVTANGRTYIGIAARQPDGSLIVLQSDGQKAQIAAAEIEGVEASKQSAMPEGLRNKLTLEQVAD
ncbi:MAG: HEAT repeat domain-containing protein, partial [Pirellulales bacterium]